VLPVNNHWAVDGCLSTDTNTIDPGTTIKVTIDLTNSEANIMASGLTPLDVLFPGADERILLNFDQGRTQGMEWEPWERVPGGRLLNTFKSASPASPPRERRRELAVADAPPARAKRAQTSWRERMPSPRERSDRKEGDSSAAERGSLSERQRAGGSG
jgi:hypothetical protein